MKHQTFECEEPAVRESCAEEECKTNDDVLLSLQEESSSSAASDSLLSEEEGWFGAIGADFRTLAMSLRETAGDVVGFVQRSARTVAAEIAELERQGSGHEEYEKLRLPWEVMTDDGDYEEDSDLKEKIFLLGLDEKTFLEPYDPRHRAENSSRDGDNCSFVLDEPHIQLIRRLLEVDENLAATHARLSGRSYIREAVFWRNYFHHCDATRETHLEFYGSSNFDALSNDGSNNSLVPAGDASVLSGEISFVNLPSPPCSMNSAGIHSVDDMVLIDSLERSP